MRPVLTCIFIFSFVGLALGQKIAKIGEFTAAQDDVQFLPGAMIVVHHDIRDSKTKVYRYRSGKFVRVRTGLSPEITRWRSFNWESVDQYNQLDLKFWVDPSMSRFLPPYSKVKAYATIPGLESGKTLVLLCYAAVPDRVPEQDRATEGGPRNLHLLLMSRKPGPAHTDTIYTKIADLLVAEEVAFGTMLVERQPAGTFVAVYFLDGGSSDYESIGVFLVGPPSTPLSVVEQHSSPQSGRNRLAHRVSGG
jgi:hypothetical protein